MDKISIFIPVLYHFAILGCFTYLLIRGVTHSFVCLFAAGALLELIRSGAYLAMSMAPGGFSANERYFPVISGIGYVGMLAFLAAFVAMTAHFLRPVPAQT